VLFVQIFHLHAQFRQKLALISVESSELLTHTAVRTKSVLGCK